MDQDASLLFVPGHADFWSGVQHRYRSLFGAYARLQDLANRILNTQHPSQLAKIQRRMAVNAWNSFSGIVILSVNGHGVDGMVLMRGIFEILLNLKYLSAHPEAVDDFIAFSAILLKKKIYDEMTPERQAAVAGSVPHMNMEFEAAAPRFLDRKGKIRNDWCPPIRERAEEAGLLPHYKAIYIPACWVHHGNIAAIAVTTDQEGEPDIAPSWKEIEKALEHGYCFVLMCLEVYAGSTGADFGDDLEQASREYLEAIAALKDQE